MMETRRMEFLDVVQLTAEAPTLREKLGLPPLPQPRATDAER